jgi:hypothetical protein
VTVPLDGDVLRRDELRSTEEVDVGARSHPHEPEYSHAQRVAGDVSDEPVESQFGARAERAERLLRNLRDHTGHERERATDDSHSSVESVPPSLHVVHASKYPPSPSGVALYSEFFDAVLSRLGPVSRRPFDASPANTQRLWVSLRAFVAGLRQRDCDQLLHVELSGRALAEFYFLLGVLTVRRRPWTVVTCHDPPSVAGSVLMFSFLDRRGLRRVGEVLSRLVGSRIERRLMSRCDTVLALTPEGAESLATQFGRAAHSIGLVMPPLLSLNEKEPLIYLPGYVDMRAPISEVVLAAAAASPTASGPWKVVIGASNEIHARQQLASLPPAARSLVIFQGPASEDEILKTYARAAVVMRLGRRGGGGNHLAASGPLSWAAAAGCLCVTDDPRPVVTRLSELGAVTYTTQPIAMLCEVLEASTGQTLRPHECPDALDNFGPAAIYAAYVKALLTDTEAALLS